jgi:hypothetical protein
MRGALLPATVPELTSSWTRSGVVWYMACRSAGPPARGTMKLRALSIALMLTACTIQKAEEDDRPVEPNNNNQQQEEVRPDPRAPEGQELACSLCSSPCGRTPCYASQFGAAPPDTESVNGFYISSFEYWPWNNGAPSYPDDIGWGFYAGSEAAKNCMAASRAQLVEILNDPPPELLEFKKQHGVYAFYNWNNDYTDAANDAMAPLDYQYLWLYNENLIKWISETNRDGRCIIPSREELAKFASECISSYPNCQLTPESQ